MKITLALLGLFLPLIATAGTLTASWTNPVTYSDTTPLPTSDITQTRVEYGTCNGAAFGTRINQGAVQGALTTITFTGLPPATYCVRAFTTAKGTESLASNVSQVTITQAPPNPPVLVTTATTAYAITKSRDRFVAVPVGTVRLGVACDASQQVLKFNVVPVAQITFTGTARPIVAVAACS